MTNTTIFSLYYHPFLFSLVLPLPAAMIKLFQRNTTTDTYHHHHYYQHLPVLGLGLATREAHRPPNVLESAMLKAPSERRLIIGSLDDVVTGMASCTESLGFESSDEIHNNSNCSDEKENYDDDEIWRRRTMRAEGRGKVRSFPPPLSSLNRNGKPSFYLRPVRKDGRLELKEVRIQRSEILHASRHNGRLTLHLIPDLEEEEEEEEERVEVEVEEWRLRGVGGSEGLKRCHEMVNHHRGHHHHVHGNLGMCGISIV